MAHKTNEEKLKAVRDHITSFPAFESHYTRLHHASDQKYLNPELDICKMHGLYVEQCKENKEKYINEWTYRKIFKNELNLPFYAPRKDTCQKCDLMKMKIEAATDNERIKLKEWYSLGYSSIRHRVDGHGANRHNILYTV